MKIRLIKSFFKRKNSLIICLGFLLPFIFMSFGYSILKTTLNIAGTTYIINNSEKEDVLDLDMEFIETKQLENVFFYDIIIHNNSENTCQNWEIKIYDNDNIMHAYEYGKREDGYRVIKNTEWDNRIETGGSVTVTIIFTVDQNVGDVSEYAKYFVENYIKATASLDEPNREGKIITNGNAVLTLKESEIEITNFTIKLDSSYETEIENEKQYIIDITNDTEYDFIKVRANVYLGTENKLLEVSPSEITCQNKTNASFELPFWMEIPKDTTTSIYLMIITNDEKFIPEIVMSAEI